MTYEAVIAALADPTRRRVFERLRGGPRSVGELAAGMPVTRPAVSQHLRVLKDAGLVGEEPRGNRRFYFIDRSGLAALRAYTDQFWSEALAAYESAARDRKAEDRR